MNSKIFCILIMIIFSFSFVHATEYDLRFENYDQYLNAPDYYSEEYQSYLYNLENGIALYDISDGGNNGSTTTRTIGVANYVHYYNGLCAPTCAQIIINYYTGTTYTQTYLATQMGTSYDSPEHPIPNPTGTYVYRYTDTLNQLLNGASTYVYRLNSQYNYFQQLKNNINSSKPFTFDIRANDVDSRYNGNALHYVIGIGYKDTSNLNTSKVYYYDPYSSYSGSYWTSYTNMNNATNHGTGYYIN